MRVTGRATADLRHCLLLHKPRTNSSHLELLGSAPWHLEVNLRNILQQHLQRRCSGYLLGILLGLSLQKSIRQ